MNEKEIAEIRRRFKPDKSNISTIRGCYVNEKKEIISQFNQPVSLMPEEEAETFLAILKRTLSGTIQKNLIDIEFSTQQVVDGQEHRLLTLLRSSALKDEEAVQAFFERVIQSVTLENNYVILLACDTYDVPYRSQDGDSQPDASGEVFSYILCSICPVKPTKPALSYHPYENEFHSRAADFIVSPPELGFMFPTFDDRAANIYNALYYSRNTAENHEEFINTIFSCEPPMPAAEQKEAFQTILSSTLAEDCNFETIQAVHSQLQEMIEEHKLNKETEPLTVSKDTIKQVLENSGAPLERVAAFEKEFEEQFGPDVGLSPRNIVDTKKIELSTPNVTIQVNPEFRGVVETRVINGTKYILIRAEDGVELNGVPVVIPGE